MNKRTSKTLLEWSDLTEGLYLKTFGKTSLKGRLKDILNETIELNRYTTLQNLREEYGDLLSTLLMGIREAGLDPDTLLTENHEKIKRREQQYISMGRKLKVAIFGGAFNPIHKGHIQVAQTVLNATNAFDEIWILPCFLHMYGKDLASPEHRLEMCRRAARVDGRIKVCDYEIKNQMGGPTFNLMNRMMEEPQYKDTHEFSVIIGLDNANSFHQWVDSEELERLVRFVVVPRKGVQKDPTVTWYLKPPHLFLTDEVPILQCSSTEVRKYLKHGDPKDFHALEGLLPGDVIEYILENGLYGAKKA